MGCCLGPAPLCPLFGFLFLPVGHAVYPSSVRNQERLLWYLFPAICKRDEME